MLLKNINTIFQFIFQTHIRAKSGDQARDRKSHTWAPSGGGGVGVRTCNCRIFVQVHCYLYKHVLYNGYFFVS
jgi:hypothetical protein